MKNFILLLTLFLQSAFILADSNQKDSRIANADSVFFAPTKLEIDCYLDLELALNVRFENNNDIIDLLNTEQYLNVYKTRRAHYCSNSSNSKTYECSIDRTQVFPALKQLKSILDIDGKFKK